MQKHNHYQLRATHPAQSGASLSQASDRVRKVGLKQQQVKCRAAPESYGGGFEEVFSTEKDDLEGVTPYDRPGSRRFYDNRLCPFNRR